MGIFADLKASGDIQKIRTGGTAKLSVASITSTIINLQDALRNVSNSEYYQIEALYDEMRKDKEKVVMSYSDYVMKAVEIITEFDKIAPCERYVRMESFETDAVLEEVRNLRDLPSSDALEEAPDDYDE